VISSHEWVAKPPSSDARVKNPFQAGTGEVQCLLDVRQGGVDDQFIEHQHQLGHGDHHEGDPQVPGSGRDGSVELRADRLDLGDISSHGMFLP